MNINLTLFAVAAAFALFIWFSARFIWPPLMQAIEDRQKQIADGLAAGEQGRSELELAQRKTKETISDARDRAQTMMSDGERRAIQIIEEAKAAAKSEAERILASAQEQIQQEVAKAKGQLREQVAVLAVSGAEKILRREVDAKAHADMLNQLKAQL